MVSERCKALVKKELRNFGLHYSTVEMGEVVINEELSNADQLRLNLILKRSGLELIKDRKTILVEKIKAVVFELVYNLKETIPIKLSAYIGKKLNHDYHYLSVLFGAHQGQSLEQYIIMHKTERIKQILAEDLLSLSEIADKLHYSSTAHLCNQFKKVVGCTPGVYRQLMRAEKIEKKMNQ
jgi:transcriptional regulator GlxA family with amidase domain